MPPTPRTVSSDPKRGFGLKDQLQAIYRKVHHRNKRVPRFRATDTRSLTRLDRTAASTCHS